MKVSTTQPFQIIYSIYEHQFLGIIFEPYVVQVNSLGKLTYQHQSVSVKNAQEFKNGLDASDFELINMMENIQPETIFKKYGNKKEKSIDFFIKIFDKKAQEELKFKDKELFASLKTEIEAQMEIARAKILNLLFEKRIFVMGSDGEPTWKEVFIEPKKATVLFHFYRNETNTHYLVTIKHEGQKIDFQYNNSKLLCLKPAWLLSENRIYTFEKEVEGAKLKPFLKKKFIEIPKHMEKDYFNNFFTKLISAYDVYAKGFEILQDETDLPEAQLIFSILQSVNTNTDLFGNGAGKEENEEKIVFTLFFKYKNFEPILSDKLEQVLVRQEYFAEKDEYKFYKTKRDLKWEKSIKNFLESLQFKFINSKYTIAKNKAFTLMDEFHQKNTIPNLKLTQSSKDGKQYFTGVKNITITIEENIDWFDLKAVVRFGEFEIPFVQLKKLILNKQSEFKLPNNSIAYIPEEWFGKYAELFAFAESNNENNDLMLKKHHFSLINAIGEDSIAKISLNRRLEKMLDFEEIEDVDLPTEFKGTLRPYQKAGYNWIHFLNKYKFGGCLADDMGLGKTVQTLAFLQSQKPKEKEKRNTSLLIVPTSLIYNWEVEAKKFTPNLKILIYAGAQRIKNEALFQNYDLVITSYGVARLDEEVFIKFYFHYIVLDESQVIKNPTSATSKMVRSLRSHFKLILTGTPVENSTQDLWTQMTFINPGLLGTQNFFRDEFAIPIEKKGNEIQLKKLHSIIKPFILRRLKTQVATDLPPKIETIRYCEMSVEQEKLYEETKSFFRNQILEGNNFEKNNLVLIQGLTKLRQIANHPLLVKPDFVESSGKLDDVLYMIEEALAENHKLLIFSQFVKHLAIFQEKLKEKNIKYRYIDGDVTSINRQTEVEIFQKDKETKIFLISLKAGGVGLNLTEADYVFLLDPWWNPAIEAQAVDRAHRIGQKNTVFTYKFITKNSVEEKILLLQEKKKNLANSLVSNEEGFFKSLSREDIEMILA